MRRASVTICIALVAVGALIMGCGEFLPLDADLRITRFDPSPVQPLIDEKTGNVLLPGTLIWVANYSQVPVIFDRFQIRYYDAVGQGEGAPEILSLRVDSEFTFFVKGIPTPDPYLPDSTATRQTAELSSIGMQVLSVNAYAYASAWPSDPAAQLEWSPFDYFDDRPIFARVTIEGKSETGEEIILEGAANISTLIKKE